jgi:hypothetical protein
MVTTTFKPKAIPASGLGAKTVPTDSVLKNSSPYGGKTNDQMKQLGRTTARYAANGKKV